MTLNELIQKLEEVKCKTGNGNIEVKGISIDTGRDGEICNVGYDDYDYCPNCGQHILWEVEDEQ